MKIIYFSSTNNIAKFIKKSGVTAQKGSCDLIINEPFILLTYTSGFGEIPTEVATFIDNSVNKNNVKYVIGSGNKNWGEAYCRAAHKICEVCNAKLLMTFELSGNIHDVNKFKNIIEEIT